MAKDEHSETQGPSRAAGNRSVARSDSASAISAANRWDDVVGPFLDEESLRATLADNGVEVDPGSQPYVLWVDVEGERLYPMSQFTADGTSVAHLREVVGELERFFGSHWSIALWLSTPLPEFGRTPMQLLQEGKSEAVLVAAKADVARRLE